MTAPPGANIPRLGENNATSSKPKNEKLLPRAKDCWLRSNPLVVVAGLLSMLFGIGVGCCGYVADISGEFDMEVVVDD